VAHWRRLILATPLRQPLDGRSRQHPYRSRQGKGHGAFIGFLCWLGFFAATQLPQGIYEKRSSTLFLINAGYWLVCLLASGALPAAWKSAARNFPLHRARVERNWEIHVLSNLGGFMLPSLRLLTLKRSTLALLFFSVTAVLHAQAAARPAPLPPADLTRLRAAFLPDLRKAVGTFDKDSKARNVSAEWKLCRISPIWSLGALGGLCHAVDSHYRYQNGHYVVDACNQEKEGKDSNCAILACEHRNLPTFPNPFPAQHPPPGPSRQPLKPGCDSTDFCAIL
jgi:hypothetical protein